MRRLTFLSGLAVSSMLLASVTAGAAAAATVVRPANSSVVAAATSPSAATVPAQVSTVVPATTLVALPPDGSFVTAQNRVWRLVGGALVYVSSWAPYGGPHPKIALTKAQYQATRKWIRDGEFIRTIQDGAVYRMVGGAPIYVSSWAAVGGWHCSISIDATNLRYAGQGYPWHAIEAFPQIDFFSPYCFSTPAWKCINATFARGGSDGRVYALVDGAPLYVTSWTVFGGARPTVTIDSAAITHAGQGRWRFLRWYPEGRSVDVMAAWSRPSAPIQWFAVAGGAPIYIPSNNNLPEPFMSPAAVDATTLARAGGVAPFNHLRARPANGTFLYAFHDADVQALSFPETLYWVSGGAAIPVVNEKACRVPINGSAVIDKIAVDNAGTGGVWDHLAKPPVPAPTPPC